MGAGLTFFDTAEAYNGPENTNSFGGFAQGAASSEVRGARRDVQSHLKQCGGVALHADAGC
jgi:hypothetical protein